MFPHLQLHYLKTIQLMVDPQLGHPANPIHPSWGLSERYSEITRPQAEFLLLASFPAPIRMPPPPAFPQRQLQFHSAKFSFGPANKSASVEKAKQRQKKTPKRRT